MHKNKSLKFLWVVSDRTKLNILFLAIIQIVLGISGILYALILKDIINAAVYGQRYEFFIAIARIVALFLLQTALRAVNRWLDELTKSTLENRFKLRLFSTLLDRDFAAVNSVHSGEWMNRLTSDTAIAANGLTTIIPGALGMAVRLAGAVIMIIALEPRSCFLIITGGIVLLLFSTLFRKKIKLLHKKVQEKDGKLRMLMQDILGSMLVVRSYAIEKESVKNAEEKMQEHRAERMKKNHFSNFCNIGFGLIMNGAYVVGAAFCGYGILTGIMSYGTFTAILQLIGQLQNPFANISGYLPQWYTMVASGERLAEAEKFISHSEESALSASEIQYFYEHDFQAVGLKNADFKYQPMENNTVMPLVLKKVSLVIKKGEYVAFTGQSGCGKSTVMKLLLSLYRLDNGEKYVVYGGGEQILDSRFQRLFAYVPQENHLMSGTIRDIISIADNTRRNNDSAIYKALKIACADEFVSMLENGVDTVLGERGNGLSEGQMQRIAVARAIFSGRPIMLLDESTSALDEKTEKKLLSNLRSMTDKTVIIVTHRHAALQICDRIIEFTESGLKEVKNDRN